MLLFLSRQAEPEGFSHFHLYVCAAFLVRWRKEILEERDFQVTCMQTTQGAPLRSAARPACARIHEYTRVIIPGR